MLPFIKEIVPEDKVFVRENQPSLGSEDFAYVSTKVPSMMINTGGRQHREKGIPMPSTALCHPGRRLSAGGRRPLPPICATRWLEENQ